MLKKIVLCLILGICLIGIVSAADLPNFNIPDNFEDIGDGVYVNYNFDGTPSQTLAIIEYTKYDADDYFKNDTKYGYCVNESKNETYNFIDNGLNEKGSCELIKVNGKNYIVESWISSDDNGKTFDNTFQNIMEFNRLNNVTPLNVTNMTNQTNSTK